MISADTRVIFCHCAFNHLIADEIRREILDALCARQVHISAIDDLCRLVACHENQLPEMAGSGRLIVAACHERAVRALLSAAGIDPAERELHVLDMRSGTRQELAACIKGLTGEPAGEPREMPDTPPEGEWIPWFPVIDPDRCIDCRQCLSFCLFGVYEGTDDGKVRVAHPANCKTNCPACARICPEGAIIFPKYAEAPINGGDVTGEAAGRARVRLDVGEALGGDLREALSRQSRMRRARLFDQASVDRAFGSKSEERPSDSQADVSGPEQEAT